MPIYSNEQVDAEVHFLGKINVQFKWHNSNNLMTYHIFCLLYQFFSLLHLYSLVFIWSTFQETVSGACTRVMSSVRFGDVAIDWPCSLAGRLKLAMLKSYNKTRMLLLQKTIINKVIVMWPTGRKGGVVWNDAMLIWSP